MKKDFVDVIYLFTLLGLVIFCCLLVVEVRKVKEINNTQEQMINIMRREQNGLRLRIEELAKQINQMNRYVKYTGG
ncbi:hypothetical protein KG091_04535 [Carnobacteriaceae bacterium zg-ZUI78]|nr:hypothetical protein [Carnobacteriaceae bacterium zg-ZUI78]